MKVHPIPAAAFAASLALGGLLLLPSPAEAAPIAKSFVCPGSSLCNPENLPILVDLGIVSGSDVVAGATAITVASGGVAGLGTFNTAIGVVGGATLLSAGAAVATGLLTSTGVPDGVTLHTSTTVSPGSTALPLTSVMHTSHGTVQIVRLQDDPGLTGYKDYCLQGLSDTDNGPYYFSSDVTFNSTPSGLVGQSGTSSSSGPCGDLPFRSSGAWWYLRAAPTGGVAAVLNSVTVNTGPDSGVTFGLGGTGPGPGWHGTIRSTVTCTSPSGDRAATATLPVDQAAGTDLTVPKLACAAGELATALSVEFQQTGTTTWLPLTSGTVPGTVKSLVTTYPDCFGPGVSPCSMELQHQLGTVWTTCGPTAIYCPDWVQQAVTDPSIYRCQYGSYTLALASCSAFRSPGNVMPNYDFATGTPKPITAPIPSTVGLPTVDPSTGDPVPVPSVDGSPSDNPADCFPTGWGAFNPLAWVLQPIQCAFIPKPDAFTRAGAAMASAWAGTSIAEVLVITAQFSGLHGPTGCDGMPVDISIDWPVHWEVHWTFGNSCPGQPLHTVAGVVSTILGFGVSIGALYTITRYLGSTIGFGGFKGDKDE